MKILNLELHGQVTYAMGSLPVVTGPYHAEAKVKDGHWRGPDCNTPEEAISELMTYLKNDSLEVRLSRALGD